MFKISVPKFCNKCGKISSTFVAENYINCRKCGSSIDQFDLDSIVNLNIKSDVVYNGIRFYPDNNYYIDFNIKFKIDMDTDGDGFEKLYEYYYNELKVMDIRNVDLNISNDDLKSINESKNINLNDYSDEIYNFRFFGEKFDDVLSGNKNFIFDNIDEFIEYMKILILNKDENKYELDKIEKFCVNHSPFGDKFTIYHSSDDDNDSRRVFGIINNSFIIDKEDNNPNEIEYIPTKDELHKLNKFWFNNFDSNLKMPVVYMKNGFAIDSGFKDKRVRDFLGNNLDNLNIKSIMGFILDNLNDDLDELFLNWFKDMWPEDKVSLLFGINNSNVKTEISNTGKSYEKDGNKAIFFIKYSILAGSGDLIITNKNYINIPELNIEKNDMIYSTRFLLNNMIKNSKFLEVPTANTFIMRTNFKSFKSISEFENTKIVHNNIEYKFVNNCKVKDLIIYFRLYLIVDLWKNGINYNDFKLYSINDDGDFIFEMSKAVGGIPNLETYKLGMDLTDQEVEDTFGIKLDGSDEIESKPNDLNAKKIQFDPNPESKEIGDEESEKDKPVEKDEESEKDKPVEKDEESEKDKPVEKDEESGLSDIFDSLNLDDI